MLRVLLGRRHGDDVNSRATPQGCPFEMLEPREAKVSRGVLRGEWGRKAPALPGLLSRLLSIKVIFHV